MKPHRLFRFASTICDQKLPLWQWVTKLGASILKGFIQIAKYPFIVVIWSVIFPALISAIWDLIMNRKNYSYYNMFSPGNMIRGVLIIGIIFIKNTLFLVVMDQVEDYKENRRIIRNSNRRIHANSQLKNSNYAKENDLVSIDNDTNYHEENDENENVSKDMNEPEGDEHGGASREDGEMDVLKTYEEMDEDEDDWISRFFSKMLNYNIEINNNNNNNNVMAEEEVVENLGLILGFVRPDPKFFFYMCLILVYASIFIVVGIWFPKFFFGMIVLKGIKSFSFNQFHDVLRWDLGLIRLLGNSDSINLYRHLTSNSSKIFSLFDNISPILIGYFLIMSLILLLSTNRKSSSSLMARIIIFIVFEIVFNSFFVGLLIKTLVKPWIAWNPHLTIDNVPSDLNTLIKTYSLDGIQHDDELHSTYGNEIMSFFLKKKLGFENILWMILGDESRLKDDLGVLISFDQLPKILGIWLPGFLLMTISPHLLKCLRDILKSGVIWFCKFSDEPDFLLPYCAELTIWTQIRHTLVSFALYGTIAIVFIWVPGVILQFSSCILYPFYYLSGIIQNSRFLIGFLDNLVQSRIGLATSTFLDGVSCDYVRYLDEMSRLFAVLPLKVSMVTLADFLLIFGCFVATFIIWKPFELYKRIFHGVLVYMIKLGGFESYLASCNQREKSRPPQLILRLSMLFFFGFLLVSFMIAFVVFGSVVLGRLVQFYWEKGVNDFWSIVIGFYMLHGVFNVVEWVGYFAGEKASPGIVFQTGMTGLLIVVLNLVLGLLWNLVFANDYWGSFIRWFVLNSFSGIFIVPPFLMIMVDRQRLHQPSIYRGLVYLNLDVLLPLIFQSILLAVVPSLLSSLFVYLMPMNRAFQKVITMYSNLIWLLMLGLILLAKFVAVEAFKVIADSRFVISKHIQNFDQSATSRHIS